MAEVEFREGLCDPTEFIFMSSLHNSPTLQVPFSDLQDASLQHLYAPQGVSIIPKVVCPIVPGPPCPASSSLPYIPVLFESQGADPNPSLSHPA